MAETFGKISPPGQSWHSDKIRLSLLMLTHFLVLGHTELWRDQGGQWAH